MDAALERLVNALELERLEDNLFRGAISDTHLPRVYGGKVLGEAIKAAQSTVEARAVHSIHAYFLREALSARPVIYEVDRSRDGGSFSARRVTAVQNGRPIFTLEASFHKSEDGIEYQGAMPAVPPPGELARVTFDQLNLEGASPKVQRIASIAAPFEFRPIDAYFGDTAPGTPPLRRVWLRTVDRLPDDTDLHRAILAYLSDYGLITTLLMPQGVRPTDENIFLASLDHAMWFHRPFRMDDWLLYVCEGVSSAGARGLARGSFYDAAGRLVVSVAQEGLVRVGAR
ncbi:MAG: acyl-CoA thioesterase II [Gammaproteobacteria bacterium]|nr:acyl-CoA thioesterase II [Gammaproteobacteria bacterium]MCP5198429.1 acyl-CoA thioesterase II [Gammaproteobacteria bacterium]